MEGRDVITVENKTSFLRPAIASVLSCRAEVLRSGKNLVFVEAAVTAANKEGRLLIAKASSTLAVIPRRLRNVAKAENENDGLPREGHDDLRIHKN
jgi:acyl-coenzyme A thioesterase PaaI-like protein